MMIEQLHRVNHLVIKQLTNPKRKNDFHIIFAHCTGFSKEMWEPVITELKKIGLDNPITTFDFRGTDRIYDKMVSTSVGHGDSIIPSDSKRSDISRPYNFHDWSDFRNDIYYVVEYPYYSPWLLQYFLMQTTRATCQVDR